MLTILVKSIVNTNNNTLAKSIANTNTNTFVTISLTVFFLFSNVHFFPRSSINKVSRMIVVRNGKITIVYSDMMLMSKHCSSGNRRKLFYFSFYSFSHSNVVVDRLN